MNDNHTLDFNHFKLHSDSTLKTFTKDELISYIKMVHNNWSGCDERLFNIMNVLQKYYELEKELGCPVEVVLKALKQHIEVTKEYSSNGDVCARCLIFDGHDWQIMTSGFKDVYTKDYKKTWWLKEDKDNHDYKEAKGENKMELKDTATLMTSKDYKERFKAEYYQVKIRYEKLLAMINKWEKGELTFTPTCPKETYNFQLRAMKEYLDILVIRAKIENIDLE